MATGVNEDEQSSLLDLKTDSEIERVFGTDGFDPLLVTRHHKPWNEWTVKGDFEIGKPIGRGTYGHVYLVRTKKEKRIVAIKIIHERDVIKDGMEYLINRETEIHGSLNHKNIIRLFGFFRDDEKLVFVLEYAPAGDVFSALKSLGRYTEEKAATYIDQISDALEYLHSNGIIHRDIKPENLLIGYFGEIKVADFGLSIRQNTSDGIRCNRTTVCGTLIYMAPEIITGAEYDEGVDIWSLGVLIYEFLTGSSPFAMMCCHQNSIKMNIQNVKFSCPSYVSFPAEDLINKNNFEAIELLFPIWSIWEFLLEPPPELIILRKTSGERIALNKIRSHDWILKNKTMEQKKLLPCFDKFQYLEAALIDKYKAAGHSLNKKRTIGQMEYENSFNSQVRSFST